MKMSLNKLFSFVLIFTLMLGGVGQVQAMPMDPMDELKVPHYFGPNPNWALSPLRQADVAVDLTGGGGTGATAQATVDPQTGAITAITVITPGNGYTSAPTVNIAGLGNSAAATAVVDYSGVVTAITVDLGGNGYSAPSATISGGGATTDATATVYGGVDAVVVTDPGLGYTFPTVEFGLPDLPIINGGVRATGHATIDANGSINGLFIDTPGFGYSAAPTVTIHNGTVDTPDPFLPGGFPAVATSTLLVQSVVVNTFGGGYTSVPSVVISDTGAGSGAAATAKISTSGTGAVTAINIDNPGSGYMTPGIKKFVDELPGLCVPPACPDYLADPTAKYVPLAVPEAKKYNGIEADEYVIGLVQYRNYFSSSMPNGALVRGYVQLETAANAAISQHYPLFNEMIDGRLVDTGYFGVTPPQYLGPIIGATKNKAVRIVFRNLLPTGSDGDLFLPVDSSLMGAGMGPMADG